MSRATSTAPVRLLSSLTEPPRSRQLPVVREPGHAGVLDPGAHREGVEPAVIVVGMPVPGVDRHVEEVLALDQVEPVDRHADLALAVELPQMPPVDRRVRAVAADPVLAEDPDAEDRVLDRTRRPPGEPDRARLAGVVEVALLAGRVEETDAGQLDLAAAPALRAPGRRLGLGLPVLDAEGAGLLAGHVVQIAVDDLPRSALGHEAALVEPYRRVAQPLDAAQVVG